MDTTEKLRCLSLKFGEQPEIGGDGQIDFVNTDDERNPVLDYREGVMLDLYNLLTAIKHWGSNG